jgi:hypothetical protein
MPSMSATKYQVLRTCPRLFYWEHIRFLQRVRIEGARGFGKLMHAGFEGWWRIAGEGDAPWAKTDEALVAALRDIAEHARHKDTDPYEVAMAEAIMIAYHARWFELEFQRLGQTGVEDWFEAQLVDPDGSPVKGWKICGRKDALVHFEDMAAPSVVEHKHTTQAIEPGADYWQKLDIDLQPSLYLDEARAAGVFVGEVRYDVVRKPKIEPYRETPEADREMTIGKGCKICGGSAKSGEIRKGSGVVDSKVANEDGSGLAKCGDCDGTGWKEAPRYKAHVRLSDEPVDDFRARVSEAISKNPGVFFQHGSIRRSREALDEARADLVAAACEVDGYWERIRQLAGGDTSTDRARRLFPRNSAACMSIFGRRCDFLDVCSGTIQDPMQSPLYQIKKRPQKGATK